MNDVRAEGVPAALGPYSVAVRTSDDLLFTSGQLGVDPETGELAEGVEAQTRQALRNLGAVLNAEGLTLADTVKTTIYLADMEDFATVNDVYAGAFSPPFPARSTVEVARLPKDARVEIDLVARVP